MQLYATMQHATKGAFNYMQLCNYATCNLCNFNNFMELMQLYATLCNFTQLMQQFNLCNYMQLYATYAALQLYATI